MNPSQSIPQKIVSRFAPSPTGRMTLGNYRTALWTYLFAQKHKGTFLLRIEDTDRERSKPEYIEALFHDLRVMGLKYDPAHIWYQSQRTVIYDVGAKTLHDQGLVYECFCTSHELSLERKTQLNQHQPPRYSGKCRALSSEQKAALKAEGRTSVLRFHIADSNIVFDDLVLGEKTFQGSEIGDFVIRKSNGDPTFFFCNAMDDALSNVTHALRGEDHLTNTPRQLALIDALGLQRPQYGHLPLILGADHKPLSKRNGSLSITELLSEGYFTSAINNYCARLGHHMMDSDLLSLEQLAEAFDIHHLSASSAHFDAAQLLYWQKRAFDAQSLTDKCALITQFAPTAHKQEAFLELVQPHITFGKDFVEWDQRLHQDCEDRIDMKSFAFSDYGWTPDCLSELAAHCGEPWAQWTQRLFVRGLKGRNCFYPLRYILTGCSDGPKLEPLYQYMDKDLIKNRLMRGI